MITIDVPQITYCLGCRKETDWQFVMDEEILVVGGESIEINTEMFRCIECDYEWEMSHPDYHPVADAYEEYERRTGKKLPGAHRNTLHTVIQSNLKEAILKTRSAQFELKNALVSLMHVFGDDHDDENFRGCTHPDCVDLRGWFKGIGLSHE